MHNVTRPDARRESSRDGVTAREDRTRIPGLHVQSGVVQVLRSRFSARVTKRQILRVPFTRSSVKMRGLDYSAFSTTMMRRVSQVDQLVHSSRLTERIHAQECVILHARVPDIQIAFTRDERVRIFSSFVLFLIFIHLDCNLDFRSFYSIFRSLTLGNFFTRLIELSCVFSTEENLSLLDVYFS